MSVLEIPSRRHLNLPDVTDVAQSEAPERKRRANEFMRAGLAHFDPSEPIPFFCECGRERCFKPVWLTSADYDRLRRNGTRQLTAGGHGAGVPSSRDHRADGRPRREERS